jgi:tRNA(Ile)-lysidine synthase
VWRISAATVDHAWHRDSAQIASRAAAQCAALGLNPAVVVPLGASGAGGGPEARAREGRYAALDRVAEETGSEVILLGHTLDDQAETVLLGLLRGSGARSLAGMPAGRGRYRRPFLGLSRQVTVRACAVLGLDVWADPSNADPAFARVRARAALAQVTSQLGGSVAEALARTADQLRDDADLLEMLAGELLEQARMTPRESESRVVVLDAEQLATAPKALRTRALLFAVREAVLVPATVGSHHVKAVDALVSDWKGQGSVALPGRASARRIGATVVIGPASR